MSDDRDPGRTDGPHPDEPRGEDPAAQGPAAERPAAAGPVQGPASYSHMPLPTTERVAL
ncbi:hypothetical protein [Clavibacter michiganensis]|uniref:hypothetical protein n=1 Tax=Clavibacter michiganensis TaxID=28447 RepID=UPI00292EE3B2|nr:hypothetical protein [Clavibacter michiganensis]